jgi:hypothetical protein
VVSCKQAFVVDSRQEALIKVLVGCEARSSPVKEHVMECYNRASGGCKKHAGSIIGGEFVNSLGKCLLRQEG